MSWLPRRGVNLGRCAASFPQRRQTFECGVLRGAPFVLFLIRSGGSENRGASARGADCEVLRTARMWFVGLLRVSQRGTALAFGHVQQDNRTPAKRCSSPRRRDTRGFAVAVRRAVRTPGSGTQRGSLLGVASCTRSGRSRGGEKRVDPQAYVSGASRLLRPRCSYWRACAWMRWPGEQSGS